MLNKLRVFFKQLFCKHYNSKLLRWHLVHFPSYEPLSVEAEYQCDDCEKINYLHLYGKDRTDWEENMGNYKKA
jgi:hypothetical protein